MHKHSLGEILPKLILEKGYITMDANSAKIIVQVYTADQATPLQDANVIISKPVEGGEELIQVLRTDANGRTQPVSLPAPPAENSLSPGNSNNFSTYNIRVDYPGYYTVENRDVPIFENQTSIQPVAMIPLSEGRENGKMVIVIETEPFQNNR